MRERIAHQHGADDRADAPEAVQPTHVARGIVHGDIVVQRRVDRARAEAVGHGPHAEQREFCRAGKAEQRRRGQKHAGRRDLTRAEPLYHALGQQAGQDRTAGDNHGDDADRGKRYTEYLLHRRPARAEQGVRQPEADEGEINDGE